jgi:hypothetical protein
MINADADNNNVFDSDDKNKKVSKLSASFFTATYFALMKKNKSEYAMKEADQVELFWKSCFIYTIQILFSYVIYMFAGFQPTV